MATARKKFSSEESAFLILESGSSDDESDHDLVDGESVSDDCSDHDLVDQESNVGSSEAISSAQSVLDEMKWTIKDNTPHLHQFTGNSGMLANLNANSSIYEIFYAFFQMN